MESMLFLGTTLLVCGSPLLLAIVGIISGMIGGKISSRVLGKLDPETSKETHAKIVKRCTVGFLVGFVIGGIPMGIGLASTLWASISDLSYLWALFVTIGIVLMGVIGTTIAGSALFSVE